jgi:hypothetical protein
MVTTCIPRDASKWYILSCIAVRLLKIIEPYFVEQKRMANAQFLMYRSKHLEQNFFFIVLI